MNNLSIREFRKAWDEVHDAFAHAKNMPPGERQKAVINAAQRFDRRVGWGDDNPRIALYVGRLPDEALQAYEEYASLPGS